MIRPTVQPSWLPVPVELDMPRKTKRPVIKLGPITLRALAGEPGAWRWRAEWYLSGQNGKMVTRALARQRGERLDTQQAITRAAELMAEGTHLAPGEQEPSEQRTVDTVQDLLELWLGAQRGRVGGEIRQSTWDAYKVACQRLVAVESFAGLPLEAIERQHVSRLLSRLRASHADQTVAVTHRVLIAALKWGAAEGICRPLPKVRWRASRPAPRMPTLDEVAATVDALETLSRGVRCREAATAIHIMLATGARPGELAAAEVDHFNLDSATWRIPSDGSKTGARSVPLNADCLEVLRAQIAGRSSGLLWTPTVWSRETSAVRIDRSWTKWIRKACAAASVELWTPKALRHLAVTRMLAAGIDVATAASITGHSPEVLLRSYAHVMEHRRRAAVLALAQPQERVIPFPQPGRG